MPGSRTSPHRRTQRPGACRAFGEGKSLDRSPSYRVTFEGSAAAPLELPTRKPWQGQDSEHVLEILCRPVWLQLGSARGAAALPSLKTHHDGDLSELLPKAKPDRLLAALAAGLLLLLFGQGVAHATAFDPEGQDWEGLSQLAAMAASELGPTRIVIRSTLSLHDIGREDGLLLVHPQRPLDAEALESFMRAGGRVVLLDDYGVGDELLAHFGIRRVALPAHPAQMLRDNPSLAIADPASIHPIVRDIPPVMTNHGTGLEAHALSPLLVVHGKGGEPDVLLAVAGTVGRGRFIAFGDASIPMNSMMRYPGNRALSRGILHYATEDDVWGKRGGKLYLLVNGFRLSGALGDRSSVGAALEEVERISRQWMGTLRHEGLPAPVAYGAAVAIGLAVIAWTSTRVGRTHKVVVPRFARPVPTVAHGGIAGHAAVLGSPNASRVLAILELKSALEEALATRLGLDRAPPPDELVAKVLAAGILDQDRAKSLGALLGRLERLEAVFARLARPVDPLERVRDANVIAVAAKVRELLAEKDGGKRRTRNSEREWECGTVPGLSARGRCGPRRPGWR
jgi:hypothetical protein